jgi:hypothetical protein
MRNRDLVSIVERLEAGEDPKSRSLGAELRRMAPGPGRPKDPPIERGLRKFKRRDVADAIFEGTLLKGEYPPEFALSVEQAKGKRTEADAVAADILGKGHSVRSIQAARRPLPIVERDDWEEFKAVVFHFWGGE